MIHIAAEIMLAYDFWENCHKIFKLRTFVGIMIPEPGNEYFLKTQEAHLAAFIKTDH